MTYTFTGTELASLTPPTGWTEPSSGGTTWTDTVNVASNGSVPNSAAVGALPAGTDYVFSAQYSGDKNYTGSTSPTGSELLTISKGSTSIATTLAGIGTGALGTSTVYDTATITFTPVTGFTKGGTVTYTFTGTELASLTPPTGWTEPSSGGTTWTDTVNVAASGSVPNSSLVGALPAGTDYVFSARYSGDQNYTGSTSPTGSELLTINKASSSVSTLIYNASTNKAISGSQPLGTSVYDTAMVTGTPFTPTGTVTYEFFTTINGSGTPVDQTVTLNANGTVPNSTPTAALAAGSYSFIAVYSGDSNYTGYTGPVEPRACWGKDAIVSHVPPMYDSYAYPGLHCTATLPKFGLTTTVSESADAMESVSGAPSKQRSPARDIDISPHSVIILPSFAVPLPPTAPTPRRQPGRQRSSATDWDRWAVSAGWRGPEVVESLYLKAPDTSRSH